MIKNPWTKIYMTLMLLIGTLMALTVCASAVLAQDPSAFPGPPPPPPHAQALASGGYLYVLDMRSIHQYYLTDDFAWKQTVTLPEVQSSTTAEANDGRPPMPPRASFLIEGDALYVMDMRSLHKYALPSLEFKKTLTLPEPDLP